MALPNQQAVDYPSFNLVILGDEGTGKTTFLKRHLTGEFEKNYEPTIGLEVHPLDFFTNRGQIRFYCWDIPAHRIHMCRALGWIIRERCQCQCAIIMVDVTSQCSYDYAPYWRLDLCIGDYREIPIVLCENKVDLLNWPLEAEHAAFMRMRNLQYYEISAKSNYNFEKPFLYLARKLVGDPNLHFVEFPALALPEVQIDIAVQQMHENEIIEAANQPLPDDDDDAFE